MNQVIEQKLSELADLLLAHGNSGNGGSVLALYFQEGETEEVRVYRDGHNLPSDNVLSAGPVVLVASEAAKRNPMLAQLLTAHFTGI